MSKVKIVITGANGQLGNELRVCSALYPQFQFIFLSKEVLPIHNTYVIEQFFEANKPDYCINCAAYTEVDKAESEQNLAYLINGESTGMLASVCNLYNTKFIHISTDYVFNGESSNPYKEDEAVDPVNVYGASKLKGEVMATEFNPQSIIIRTSWVYSAFGKNFVKTMIRLMKEKDSLNVVSDQLGSPTYAADLAQVLLSIIDSGKWLPGLYHYSNEGVTNWYNFANVIKELVGSSCNVIPIPTSSFPTPAKRPRYSVFNKQKIKTAYQFAIPDWRDSLTICVQKLIN